MVHLILSHWATYLLLTWVAIVAVVNLWPRRKLAAPMHWTRYSPARNAGDELELVQRSR